MPSKALVLRGRLPAEVIAVIEGILRPHDMRRLQLEAKLMQALLLAELEMKLQHLTLQVKPWPPLAMWDWEDTDCIACWIQVVVGAGCW